MSIDQLAVDILARFRDGADTSEIARTLNIPEAKVSQLLWIARCRDKGLPATFLTPRREIKMVREAA